MSLRIFVTLLICVPISHTLNADEPSTFANQVIDGETIGLVRGADSNAFAAYSKVRKQWSTHTFADYLTVKPATLGESFDKKDDMVVCFHCTGGTVTELVAVDCSGKFQVHKLKSPLNQDVKPILNGGGVIYYIADEIVYAFSGKTGTWDTHHVPGLPSIVWKDDRGTPPDIKLFDAESEDGIVIRRPIGTAKFLADKGYWDFTPTPTKNGG